MTQATYSIRLDQEKKTEFDEICEQLGLSASTAIATFVNKTVEERGLPYELKLKARPRDYGIVEADQITREELMAEVQKGINSAKTEATYSVDEAFGSILEAHRARV